MFRGFHLIALLFLALVAFVMRVAVGPYRPMHVDEAVNAHVFAQLLSGEGYRYDPQDKHGPVLHYATWPVAKLAGASSLAELHEWQVRLVPALFGAALLLVPWWLAEGLGGRSAALGAAGFLGFAAPFVYYGAYWIHESLFVFFTLLAVAAGWRWSRTFNGRWAVLGGISAGVLLATKETVVISFACAAAGMVGVFLWCRPRLDRARTTRALGCSFGVAVVVALALYTAGFSRWEALGDLVRAVSHFAARAGGEGHEKPWFTYLAWFGVPNARALPWAGWLLLAAAAAGLALDRRPPRERGLTVFLAGFAASGAFAYSVIPYKTPWLFLNVLAPLAVLAGAGVAQIARRLTPGAPLAGGLALGALLVAPLLAETHRLCVLFPADTRNPLAYAPTVPDAPRLQRDLETYAAARPDGLETFVQVIGAPEETWPLPWYLRRFERRGFWPEIPDRVQAPIVITTPGLAESVSARLGEGWTADYRGIRPEVLVVVFLKKEGAP